MFYRILQKLHEISAYHKLWKIFGCKHLLVIEFWGDFNWNLNSGFPANIRVTELSMKQDFQPSNIMQISLSMRLGNIYHIIP
jgi:hypothetical protein